MIEFQERGEYYISGSWPAQVATLIRLNKPGGPGHLVAVSHGHCHIDATRLHKTRLEADETTLATLRIRLKNSEEQVLVLQADIAELEAKKGQA